jgi:hypothetical protein
VGARLGQRRLVGYRPALEQEVACLFIDEHRRAVVGVALRVFADEL